MPLTEPGGIHFVPSARNHASKVFVELHDGVRIPITRHEVDFPVIVEQDREVVKALDLVALPRTVGGPGTEDLQAGPVYIAEDVEHPVVIPMQGAQMPFPYML